MKHSLLIISLLFILSCTEDMIFQPREPVPDSPILYEIRNKDLKEELLLFSKTEAPYFFSADSIIIVSIKRQPPFTYYRIFYEENADVVMMNKNVFFAKIDNTVIAIQYENKQIVPEQYATYIEGYENIPNMYRDRPVWLLTFKDGICIKKKKYFTE